MIQAVEKTGEEVRLWRRADARLVVSIVAWALAILGASGAEAQETPMEETPAPQAAPAPPSFSPGVGAAGMGQAQSALSVGTNGVFNNPAGMARAYMYALEGAFIYTPTGNVLSAAIVDSQTNPKWSGGVGFNYYFSRGDGTELQGIDVRVGTAFPVVQDRVSIGLGGRYLRFKSGDLEVLGGFSLDAGAIFTLVDRLTVGIAAKNLLDPCKKTECVGWVPMTIGGGLAYGSPEFAVALDVDADLNSSDAVNLNVEVGGEYLIAQMVPVRLGYRRLGVSSANILTAGTGWKSKTAGIDLSYQHDLGVKEFGNLLLGVSVFF